MMIFLVITLISFSLGFTRFFSLLLYENIGSVEQVNFENIMFYNLIILSVRMLINPFLIFIIFYKIGTKFDIKLNLKPTIIRLLLGAYLGYFISSNLVFLIHRSADSFLSTILGNIFSTTFLGIFFVGFSALVIAYFRHQD